MADRRWLQREISGYLRSAERGCLPGGGPFFDEPLFGVAALDDPLFADYQKIIGAFHLTPRQWLVESFPDAPVAAGGSVLVWVLPIAEATCRSNRRETAWPSREWALTRQHGESLNLALRQHVVDLLLRQGRLAVAPQLSPQWREVVDVRVGAASSWSERHAAYAAGLGTFSLNDGLITTRGIAHRIGSVITDLVLEPDPRTWPTHLHNCLFHRNKSCGVCIERCPVGAIGPVGHDKQACMAYVYGSAVRAVGPRYGVQVTGCGLCQTRVPCEKTIPGD